MRPDSIVLWRRRAAVVFGAIIFSAAVVERAAAQSSSSAGTLFLLLPVGAETVGIGEAAVAEELGTESVWSNPAGIAQQTQREGAIHHSETIAAQGDVITLLLPKKSLGVFALSFSLLDFGNQQITDQGGTPIGIVLPRDILMAGTYAAALGKHVSLGATFKRIQYRVDCSGQCANVSTFSASSSAIDFGGQYDFFADSSVRFGAAIRNVGSKLQVNDGEQADPLPTRIEVGLSYGLGFIKEYVSDVSVRLAVDVIATQAADQPSARFGADVTYEKSVHLRGGYIINDSDGATAALGFGIVTGRLTFDIARTFGGLSEDAGKTPAYISLRFSF